MNSSSKSLSAKGLALPVTGVSIGYSDTKNGEVKTITPAGGSPPTDTHDYNDGTNVDDRLYVVTAIGTAAGVDTVYHYNGDSGGLGTTENPYGSATGIQDRTTGWVQYGHRYYDPTTGTWTQMDTLDNPLDPTNANRYAYAGGDPINNIDPTGRDGYDCFNSWLGVGLSVAGIELSLFAGGAASVASTGVLTPVAAGGLALGWGSFMSSAYPSERVANMGSNRP